jgi:fluoroacetyl-CoA thioesterase
MTKLQPATTREVLRSGQLYCAALVVSRIFALMTKDLAPGITRTHTYITTMEMRARQLDRDVFSTPAMIGLMERTCVDLTEPYLAADEQTVGIHVDVRHMAPTRIGQSVTVKAELVEVKENKLRYSVSATNDDGVTIGEGRHRRAVIHTTSFGADAKT